MDASPGEAFGGSVEGVASIEAPSEAGKIALGVFGADVMVGSGEGCLDVAERGVDPGERRPAGGLSPGPGDHRPVAAAGGLDGAPAGKAIGDQLVPSVTERRLIKRLAPSFLRMANSDPSRAVLVSRLP